MRYEYFPFLSESASTLGFLGGLSLVQPLGLHLNQTNQTKRSLYLLDISVIIILSF